MLLVRSTLTVLLIFFSFSLERSSTSGWFFPLLHRQEQQQSRRKTIQTIGISGPLIFLSGSVAVAASTSLVPPPPLQKEPTASLASVLQLRSFLEQLAVAVRSSDKVGEEWDPTLAVQLIQSIPSQENRFKAIFDAYSDPVSYKQKFVDQNAFLVYYTKGFDGPGRPSIESDLPVKQTMQYGARNDAWVAWDKFLAEWAFQKRNTIFRNSEGSSSLAIRAEEYELTTPLEEALTAIDNYLAVSGVSDRGTAK